MYNLKGEVPEEEYLLPIGQADILQRGEDVTVVSFGKMLHLAQQAAKEVDCAVEMIDLATVRPIDYATIVGSVQKTNRLVIVEEAWPLASISSEIAYHVQKYAFDYLDAPVIRITNQDVPVPYAPTLLAAVLPQKSKIIEAIREVCYAKN